MKNIIYAFGGNKMPLLNPKDPQSIKKWQDWAVKNKYMTQDQVNTGYGIYGPKTKAAYNKALNASKNEDLNRLSLKEAQYQYQNAGLFDGVYSVIDDALNHVLWPEFMNLRPNKPVKKQIAAIIGYKGLPKPGESITIDYSDYGKMSGQSSNPNEQSAENNAAGKTIGLTKYTLSEDGKSVEVHDRYDFHTERVPVRDSSGNIISWKTKEEHGYLDGSKDAGWGTALSGLYRDIVDNKMLSAEYKPAGKSLPMVKRLEHLGENFGTRQGKSRESSFIIPISRINRWNK